MVCIHRNASGLVVVDDRYPPLVISTFIGKTSPQDAEWHERERRAAVLTMAQTTRRVICISDTTRSRAPGSAEGRFWTEGALQSPAELRDATLATFVVARSLMVRGAIAALGWMDQSICRIETFSSLTSALEAAKRRLAGLGLPPFEAPETYDLPKEAGVGVNGTP